MLNFFLYYFLYFLSPELYCLIFFSWTVFPSLLKAVLWMGTSSWGLSEILEDSREQMWFSCFDGCFFFFFCQAMEMCCSCELAVMWCWLHYNVAVSQPPETRGLTRRAPSISNNSMVMAKTHKRMIQEISSPLLLFSLEIEVETLRRSQSEDTGTSEQLYGT